MAEPSSTGSSESSLKAEPAEDYASVASSGHGLASDATVTKEGRISFVLNLKKALPDLPPSHASPVVEFAVDPALGAGAAGAGLREDGRVPSLAIVVMIVGSRGDVQPFLALGKELARHGHRVRIATHGTFRSFVADAGLEFFDIGGDPAELMSYMVRNPGLMPGWASLTNGDIGRKRKTMAKILDGCWKACFEPDGPNGENFAADAIIANPPSFAHVHCAEALGIPLQMSFTMPWSATTSFPHPLVNIAKTNAAPGLTNYFSYALAELLTWHGLGDLINKFREKQLRLDPLPAWAGAGILDRLKVPWTYCFSPQIVPKPQDWTNHIDVVGFYFLDLATGYTPPADLLAFLEAGPPPVYIGFGSVVVDNPDELTQTIFEATRRAGVRALVSPGWGKLGGADVPAHIFVLPNVPHDWLFQRVAAVCHHGGAGTMAIGLRLGKPTIIVPFFGDQPFWGKMVHRAGAGPKPIRREKMGVERLADAIKFCLTPEAQSAAEEMGAKIRASNGVDAGVRSFHQHLPLMNMRCDLCPEWLAVWWSAEHSLKLSACAAQILCDAGVLKLDDLVLHRPLEYDSLPEHSSPLQAGGIIESFRRALDARGHLINPVKAVSGLVMEPYKGAKREGFKGFLKGTVTGYANATRHPITGIWGAISKSMNGDGKSSDAPSVDQQLRTIRTAQGIAEFSAISPSERAAVVDRFRAECAKERARERRKSVDALMHDARKLRHVRAHRAPDAAADSSPVLSPSSSFASSSTVGSAPATETERELAPAGRPHAHSHSHSHSSTSNATMPSGSQYSHVGSLVGAVNALPSPGLPSPDQAQTPADVAHRPIRGFPLLGSRGMDLRGRGGLLGRGRPGRGLPALGRREHISE